MATTPAPTVTSNTSPFPYTWISFSSIPTSASVTLIYVYRTANGVTEVIRNANGVTITGSASFSVQDFDVPFGVSVTYTGKLVIGGADQGLGPSTSITLNVNQLWITDPLDPTNSLGVDLTGSGSAVLGMNSFASVKRGYDVNKSYVLGKARPIVQFYGQKGIEGTEFEVLTTGTTATTAMGALLATSPVLIRPPVRMTNLPSQFYATLTAVQNPLTWRNETSNQVTNWVLQADEVEPQSLEVVFSLFSYAYWSARLATYTAANAIYGAGSYDTAVRTPPA